MLPSISESLLRAVAVLKSHFVACSLMHKTVGFMFLACWDAGRYRTAHLYLVGNPTQEQESKCLGPQKPKRQPPKNSQQAPKRSPKHAPKDTQKDTQEQRNTGHTPRTPETAYTTKSAKPEPTQTATPHLQNVQKACFPYTPQNAKHCQNTRNPRTPNTHKRMPWLQLMQSLLNAREQGGISEQHLLSAPQERRMTASHCSEQA